MNEIGAMFSASTVQLLRFHFSIFLIPVYLFALSQLENINWFHAAIIYFVLHFLIYPSSNGYNSFMDRDTSPIGGVEKPLLPTPELFIVTIVMDCLGILMAFMVSIYFVIGMIIYIAASRAYSYRGIRLKKYPVWGYLTVIIFQGAMIFFLVYHGSSMNKILEVPLLPMIASSALIGGYYPLTQIYQHEADKNDGITTISIVLGIRGTFIFCGIVFAIATLLMFFTFRQTGDQKAFYIFLLWMFPMIVYFLWWMRQSWENEANANYKSSLQMNVLAAVCTTLFFTTLLLMKV